jgi:hypothetical protein
LTPIDGHQQTSMRVATEARKPPVRSVLHEEEHGMTDIPAPPRTGRRRDRVRPLLGVTIQTNGESTWPTVSWAAG